MNKEPGYKEIWRMAFPLMLGNVSQNLVLVVDTLFLGRLPEAESRLALGAQALAGVLFLSLQLIGLGFGTGIQILIARRHGEDKKGEVGSILHQGFFLLGILGFLLSICIFFILPKLMYRICQSAEVAEAANGYLITLGFGFLPFLFFTCIQSFYWGIGRTGILAWGLLLQSGLNILLDYVLIFGHWGFPAMGIRGAGLASAISMFGVFILMLVFILCDPEREDYGLFRKTSLDRPGLFSLFNLSAPVCARHFLSIISWFVFFVFIEKMDGNFLAAANILRILMVLGMGLVLGVAVAGTTVISQAIGRQASMESIMRLTGRCVFLSALSGSALGIHFLLFPNFVFDAFTDIPALADLARQSRYVLFINLVLFATAIGYLYSLSGTGDTKTTMIIENIAVSLYLIFAWLVTLKYPQPLHIVWGADFVYCIALLSMAYPWLKSGKWRLKSV